MQNPQNLIWIDLEMTGLDPDRDVIIRAPTCAAGQSGSLSAS
ncbi:hypothetical protein ACLBUN_03425, partial [Pseudomonas aeruginosa]